MVSNSKPEEKEETRTMRISKIWYINMYVYLYIEIPEEGFDTNVYDLQWVTMRKNYKISTYKTS